MFGPNFRLPNLDGHVEEGSGKAVSIQDYFNTMLDTNMDWDTAARIRQDWGGTFALKGIMSAGDARKAVEIGADAIWISNHGGRQLDGSRAPFDQLTEIVEAVDGEIEIILDGGVRRGTHVLKSLAAGRQPPRAGDCISMRLPLRGRTGSNGRCRS